MTPEQAKRKAAAQMRARLARWTTDPPKQRKYPKGHPWRNRYKPKMHKRSSI